MAGHISENIAVHEDVSPERMRMVVIASAAGTIFEWYDFFIFGLMTSTIAAHFFTGVNPTTGFIFALLTFAAGFAFRPLGAVVFGHFGDQHGRKGAFLWTISMMGLATFAVGFLPTKDQIGIAAPFLLLTLRVIQGFALGGEYGGAAIYVAEHAKPSRRGFATSLVQTSAAIGLLTALITVYACRVLIGAENFEAWGWRVPFLLSVGLLIVSVVIRMRLEESPAFEAMRASGGASKAPLKEAFTNKAYLKLMIFALFGLMMGQGVVWYTAHFYLQVFLEKQMKVDKTTITQWLMIVTFISAFLYVFFGWLSDKIGRRPVMLFGMMLAVVSFFPGFAELARATNPALVAAQNSAPVYVFAPPDTCALQFNPLGATADGRDPFDSSCDVAKSYLSANGIGYQNQDLSRGAAYVQIGAEKLVAPDISQMDAPTQKAAKTEFGTKMAALLHAAGYPDKADPAAIKHDRVLLVMLIFVVAATSLYGPLAASLVEIFPIAVRYSALSIPYHIGTGIFGGFMPAIAVAIVATTGNGYSGLWYPVIITSISVIISLFFLPETKGRPVH